MSATTADTFKVAFRFHPGDARLLRELARRAQQHDVAECHAVFNSAAEAASTGEPLIVVCSTEMEAKMMAVGYTRYGVRQPVLEDLR